MSIEVSALYTNIPQDKCITDVDEVLEHETLPYSKELLKNLLELILKFNIFKYNLLIQTSWFSGHDNCKYVAHLELSPVCTVQTLHLNLTLSNATFPSS